MTRKRCTVQYRQTKLDDLTDDFVLKNSIVDALLGVHDGQQVGANARARIIDLDQDGSFVILNKVSEPDSWENRFFYGQLIHLTEGADVAAVLDSLENDTEEYLLEQVNIGDDARVLKGVLYFAVVDNHVGLIENQSVKGKTLERYLTALLQRDRQLQPGEAVILNAEFLAADGRELPATAELTVSAEPNRGAMLEEVGRVIEDEAARARREGATVLDVLRTLGWDDAAIAAIEDEVPDDGWLEGFFKVVIKRKGRRRAISRATINEALRNIDADDLGLRGPDGTEKGGLRKLTSTCQVDAEGTLLDPSHAVEQIVNTLRDWAAEGKIDCNLDGG